MDCASQGILYVVSTPIGNMDDITIRAVEILRNSDLILAEDTREIQKILSRHDIKKPILAYTDQKHDKISAHVLNLINMGQNVSLTSDSGTPLISDPGFKLVEQARKLGLRVVSIPGPSAPVAAMSICGLPTDKFVFLGFLPKTKTKKRDLLEKYIDIDASLIIFESPQRINALLEEIYVIYGSRKASVIKDLTKVYEMVRTADLKELVKERFIEKGEYILIVAKKDY